MRRQRERQRELSLRALTGKLANQTPLMLPHALRGWKVEVVDRRRCGASLICLRWSYRKHLRQRVRRYREHQQKSVQSCLATLGGEYRAVMEASVFTAWRDVVETD